MGALQCTEGQVPSTEEPVSAMGRRGLRGPQMHWCQDPRHTMSCAGLSGTEGDVRDRDRVRKMEPKIETEKWRQRKTERERHRDGDRETEMESERWRRGGEMELEMETEKWRQRKIERKRDRDGDRERGGDRKMEGGRGDGDGNGDRERRRCRETRETGGEREGGHISRPPGSPSSSLSISTFQPKGAFLTAALTLESQVLHSVSRK